MKTFFISAEKDTVDQKSLREMIREVLGMTGHSPDIFTVSESETPAWSEDQNKSTEYKVELPDDFAEGVPQNLADVFHARSAELKNADTLGVHCLDAPNGTRLFIRTLDSHFADHLIEPTAA